MLNVITFNTFIRLYYSKEYLFVNYHSFDAFFPDEIMRTAGTVAIAVLSTLLIIAILINILLGRKIISNQNSKRHTNILMSRKQNPSQTYADLTVTEEAHAYSTLGSDVYELPYQVISDGSNKIK